MANSGELPPGVRVFERGWLSSNNVLHVGGRNAALVDSGYCSHSEQTRSLIRNALGDRPLDLLLNTHLHSDHCGGNAALQAAYAGLQTLIPPGQADAVRRWDPVALSYEPTGQQCPPFSLTGVLRPGTDVILGDLRWQVHSAPGHDPHSVILFEPAFRTLLSADALWENGFGVVFPELEGHETFDEVAATLSLIESLQPSTIIPGHGSLFRDVSSALTAARRRLDAYAQAPLKHAKHASKVLLKFKLLELQRVKPPELTAWALNTPYIGLIQRRWFPQVAESDYVELLIDELVGAGAAAIQEGWLVNA